LQDPKEEKEGHWKFQKLKCGGKQARSELLFAFAKRQRHCGQANAAQHNDVSMGPLADASGRDEITVILTMIIGT